MDAEVSEDVPRANSVKTSFAPNPDAPIWHPTVPITAHCTDFTHTNNYAITTSDHLSAFPGDSHAVTTNGNTFYSGDYIAADGCISEINPSLLVEPCQYELEDGTIVTQTNFPSKIDGIEQAVLNEADALLVDYVQQELCVITHTDKLGDTEVDENAAVYNSEVSNVVWSNQDGMWSGDMSDDLNSIYQSSNGYPTVGGPNGDNTNSCLGVPETTKSLCVDAPEFLPQTPLMAQSAESVSSQKKSLSFDAPEFRPKASIQSAPKSPRVAAGLTAETPSAHQEPSTDPLQKSENSVVETQSAFNLDAPVFQPQSHVASDSPQSGLNSVINGVTDAGTTSQAPTLSVRAPSFVPSQTSAPASTISVSSKENVGIETATASITVFTSDGGVAPVPTSWAQWCPTLGATKSKSCSSQSSSCSPLAIGSPLLRPPSVPSPLTTVFPVQAQVFAQSPAEQAQKPPGPDMFFHPGGQQQMLPSVQGPPPPSQYFYNNPLTAAAQSAAAMAAQVGAFATNSSMYNLQQPNLYAQRAALPPQLYNPSFRPMFPYAATPFPNQNFMNPYHRPNASVMIPSAPPVFTPPRSPETGTQETLATNSSAPTSLPSVQPPFVRQSKATDQEYNGAGGVFPNVVTSAKTNASQSACSAKRSDGAQNKKLFAGVVLYMLTSESVKFWCPKSKTVFVLSSSFRLYFDGKRCPPRPGMQVNVAAVRSPNADEWSVTDVREYSTEFSECVLTAADGQLDVLASSVSSESLNRSFILPKWLKEQVQRWSSRKEKSVDQWHLMALSELPTSATSDYSDMGLCIALHPLEVMCKEGDRQYWHWASRANSAVWSCLRRPVFNVDVMHTLGLDEDSVAFRWISRTESEGAFIGDNTLHLEPSSVQKNDTKSDRVARPESDTTAAACKKDAEVVSPPDEGLDATAQMTDWVLVESIEKELEDSSDNETEQEKKHEREFPGAILYRLDNVICALDPESGAIIEIPKTADVHFTEGCIPCAGCALDVRAVWTRVEGAAHWCATVVVDKGVRSRNVLEGRAVVVCSSADYTLLQAESSGEFIFAPGWLLKLSKLDAQQMKPDAVVHFMAIEMLANDDGDGCLLSIALHPIVSWDCEQSRGSFQDHWHVDSREAFLAQFLQMKREVQHLFAVANRLPSPSRLNTLLENCPQLLSWAVFDCQLSETNIITSQMRYLRSFLQ